ncbi:MAG: polysaccharide deacetylase family protein [Woeseia sp.]
MTAALTRALGALLSPAGGRARLAVFSYHQVLQQADNLRRGEPDRARFLADLEVIGRVFAVLPLPEAVERLQAGALPARAACITFDDGYANNYEFAAPSLERAGLPASFFIAGDAVDRGVMWNDLIIEGARIRGSNWIVEGLAELDQTPLEGDDAGKLVTRILKLLKYQPLEKRWDLAEAFFRENTGRELPRLMMDRSMVADLARRGFDIGGHTLHHPILKELTDANARTEITGCSRWIEEVTGRAARTFAYPNGIPGRDFGPEHAAMVEEAGFETAVTTRWSVAGPDTERYGIPRIGPWWRLGSSLALGFLRAYGGSYVKPAPTMNFREDIKN